MNIERLYAYRFFGVAVFWLVVFCIVLVRKVAVNAQPKSSQVLRLPALYKYGWSPECNDEDKAPQEKKCNSSVYDRRDLERDQRTFQQLDEHFWITASSG